LAAPFDGRSQHSHRLSLGQATKFALAINLKTAKALGFELPPRYSPVPTR